MGTGHSPSDAGQVKSTLLKRLNQWVCRAYCDKIVKLSENGRTEADKYYVTTRPFEGRSVAIINQSNMGIWSV